jgi:hypothetical protein
MTVARGVTCRRPERKGSCGVNHAFFNWYCFARLTLRKSMRVEKWCE